MALGKNNNNASTFTKAYVVPFTAAAAAGGIAAAAYLDGKYQLRRELSYIGKMKRAERAYAKAGM